MNTYKIQWDHETAKVFLRICQVPRRAEVEKLVAHRLGRERKVLAGLKSISPAHLDELVVIVYSDVDSSLHEWAKLSMTAHLIKLEREGDVFKDEEDRWVFKR